MSGSPANAAAGTGSIDAAMSETLRVAAWQCEALSRDVPGNLARLDAQAALAARQGVQLLVAPEMFLTGYAVGADAIRALAEPVDGPAMAAVRTIARRHAIALALGWPEAGEAGAVHNSAVLIGPDGAVLGRHRKQYLFGDIDRAVFNPGDGSEPLATLNGWRLGLAICYDIEFPELARQRALAGADAIVVPTANMLPYDLVPEVLVRARAIENQVYVAYANYCGTEHSLHYGGLSCLAPPDGTAPAQAGREPSWLVGELSRDRLWQSRARFPYLPDSAAVR